MTSQVVKVRTEKLRAWMTCPLCLKLLREASTISLCLHTFCRKCIYEKLSNEEVDSCPVCNIDLGCIPVEKLRPDHNLQDIRAKIFPFKRRKVTAPELSPSISLPIKRKERSLSSLIVTTPKVSIQTGLTGRRTKYVARKNAPIRGSSFSTEEPIKKGTVAYTNLGRIRNIPYPIPPPLEGDSSLAMESSNSESSGSSENGPALPADPAVVAKPEKAPEGANLIGSGATERSQPSASSSSRYSPEGTALGVGDVFAGLKDFQELRVVEDTMVPPMINLAKLALQRDRKRKAEAVAQPSAEKTSLLPSSPPLQKTKSKSARIPSTSPIVEKVGINKDPVALPSPEKRPREKSTSDTQSSHGKRQRVNPNSVLTGGVAICPQLCFAPIPADASALNDLEVVCAVANAIALPGDVKYLREAESTQLYDESVHAAVKSLIYLIEFGARFFSMISEVNEGKNKLAAMEKKLAKGEEIVKITAEALTAEQQKREVADKSLADANAKNQVLRKELEAAKDKISTLNKELEKAAEEKEAFGAVEFERGKIAWGIEYADEVPVLENRGFKHGWMKALETAGVTLDVPIPYEWEAEPCPSDPVVEAVFDVASSDDSVESTSDQMTIGAIPTKVAQTTVDSTKNADPIDANLQTEEPRTEETDPSRT